MLLSASNSFNISCRNSANLVDQMMEKYTNRLEDIVRDRTQQLEEEKMKTEKLLEKMLPP